MFDKVIISQHFLKNYCYPIELILKKIKKYSNKKLIIEQEKHHVFQHILDFIILDLMKQFVFIDGAGAVLENGDVK